MDKLGIIVATDDEFNVVHEDLVSSCIEHRVTEVSSMKVVEYVFNDYNSNISTNSHYNVVLVKSGIGKVNATHGATLLAYRYQAKAILNIGTAGTGVNLDIGELVLVKNCIQHDIDITHFGYQVGELPGQSQYCRTTDIMTRSIMQLLEEKGIKYNNLDIGSGDSFTTYDNYCSKLANLGVELLDMETSAIAITCENMGLAFSAIRIVSDTLDDNEYKDNNQNVLTKYSGTYSTIINRLLEGWYHATVR